MISSSGIGDSLLLIVGSVLSGSMSVNGSTDGKFANPDSMTPVIPDAPPP